jgi:hypothetical protein
MGRIRVILIKESLLIFAAWKQIIYSHYNLQENEQLPDADGRIPSIYLLYVVRTLKLDCIGNTW